MRQWERRHSFRNTCGRLFFRWRKMAESSARALLGRLVPGLRLERKRAFHGCDARTADAYGSVRIHADFDSSISTDAPSLSRHVIGSAGRQEAALPLEGGDAAVAASANRIL